VPAAKLIIIHILVKNRFSIETFLQQFR
jgi:hypothetical protein